MTPDRPFSVVDEGSAGAGSRAAAVETLVIGHEPPAAAGHIRPLRARTVLVGLVVLVAVLYLVVVSATADRFPRHAVVGGVAVGGLDRAGAEEKLRRELGPRVDEPFLVKIETDVDFVPTTEAGLSVDYGQSARVPGHGSRYGPRRVWWALFGGYSVEPVVQVDQARLATRVAQLSRDHDHPPANATLRCLESGGVAINGHQDGLTLDRTSTAHALQSTFVDPDRPPVTVPLQLTPPAVLTPAAYEATVRYAMPAVSGDIVVRLRAGGSVRLTPDLVRRSLSFVPRGHALVPLLDGDRLLRQARVPADAHVSAQALARAVASVLTETGSRRTVTV